MMAITHTMISTALVPLVLSNSSPMVVGLAIVGSQLPDLDTSTSIIGQVFYPLSSFLEKRYPHRTVTHSFVAIALVAGLWAGTIWGISYAGWYQFTQADWFALWLGMFFSIISDTFTVQGCQLFWPVQVWCYSGSSWDKKRIRTGSPAEISIVAIATALSIWVIFGSAIGGGGLVNSVTQSIGVGDAQVSAYNRMAATHQVWAEIKGNFTSDRTVADGKYEVIDMVGESFILKSGEKIYQVGRDIQTSGLKISQGEPVTITVYAVPFEDDPIAAKLILLREAHPSAQIFLTGDLTVDLPEEIQVIPEVQAAETLEVNGTTAKLFYLNIDRAIQNLEAQYGTGTIEAKVFGN